MSRPTEPIARDAAAALSSVLGGGGEMGTLMRSIDWAKTPVGPVETWPQSLRTVLSILLNSEQPMFLWWGPALVQFYNDSYLPILGSTKHPAAMGQQGRECFKESWTVLAPLIEAGFAGRSTYTKDGMVPIDRHGFLEECYFTFGFTPVRDETGAAAGFLSVMVETTGRVIGERRLTCLRNLSIRTAVDRNVAGVHHSIEAVLGDAGADVAFALLYDMRGDAASLVTCAGLKRGSAAAPTDVRLDDGSLWPLGAVARSGEEEVVENLDSRLGVLTGAAWPEPVTRALVLPLSTSANGEVTTVLVAGLSPRLLLGDDYRNFLQLLARQIATSIASTRAAEQETQRAAELVALDHAKTAFFSNVSHEFRTPLTLILGPVDDALAQAEKSLSGTKLELVGRNARRLQRLVNTLLDFSRIEAGRAQANYQRTDLSRFTADLASTFRSLVEKAGLTLTVDCPPSAEAVYVDREMYEKVVLNLLSNAFKFTFEGEIRVSLDVHEGAVRLTVADTGVGVPEAELPRLFERFHQVQGTKGRSSEGSGIGLALVQEVVKLHGGSISVESQIGRGTHFVVSLPLGKAHLHSGPIEPDRAVTSTWLGAAPYLDEAASWVSNAPAARSAVATATDERMFGRIMVADDNADMREYLHGLLTAQGWDVEAVSDGEQALRRARAFPPDLVLTDVMMPGLDGVGLLEALREDERTRAVPVILLSARAGDAASIEAMKKGADDYLVKPFSGKELVSRVAARLEMARTRGAALAREQAVRAEVVSAHEKLHSLFKQAPIAICILEGPEHRYTFANDANRALLGGRDLVGRALLDVVPEVNGQGINTLLDEVLATGEPFVGNELLIRWDRFGKGQLEDVFFNLVFSPKRNERGEVDGIISCASEVTEQVQARQRVESLMEELEVADQRKDEFLAMLAHELRTPLAAISIALTMLDLVEGDAAEASKHRETARRQVRNLVRLVDDLLDVSRITRGKVDLRLADVDLAVVVQHALVVMRPVIEARGHELSVTTAAGAFPVNADATRLEQVLVNILTNAEKYTEPGGTLSVRLGREIVDGAAQAVVRVRDTGRGIPQDMLERVFDVFVQVSPTLDRSSGGLGLGLALVKRLVEMHGGSVSAHSDEPGKGSEIVVRLPLVKHIRDNAPPVNDVALPPSTDLPTRRRIVVVEDSADLRVTLGKLLELLGHEVVLAEDGVNGAARILEVQPDVALIDVGLPGIDGYEVARRVRAEPGGDKLYLVALTGYGGAAATAKAEAAGFDLHMIKPIEFTDLRQVVSGARRRTPEQTPEGVLIPITPLRA